MSRTAIVVGDHPCIAHLTDAMLPEGVRIGVNRAIKHPGIAWDYWANKDGPKVDSHHSLEQIEVPEGITVWSRQRHGEHWKRLYPHLEFDLTEPCFEKWRRSGGGWWLRGTIFYAIGRAAHDLGCTTIHLWGVEMCGGGNYAHPVENKARTETREQPWQTRRWMSERKDFVGMYRELRHWDPPVRVKRHLLLGEHDRPKMPDESEAKWEEEGPFDPPLHDRHHPV